MRKIIGFTTGYFDIMHPGHILMLEECKRYCDYLIVGVQSDSSIDRPEKNSPIQSHKERLGIVNSIKFVDEVKPYDTESDVITDLETSWMFSELIFYCCSEILFSHVPFY